MRDRLTTAYGKLPVGVQNAVFTAWGAGIRHQRFGKEFQRRLAWLRETDWWSTEEIGAYQDEQLRSVVRHAFETVPGYRALLMEAGASPEDVRTPDDLATLPVLTKERVRADPLSFVSRSYNPRRLRRNLTSGTTGTPLTVYLTSGGLQFQMAVWWRHRARFGLKLGDPFLMFGARLPVLGGDDAWPIWRTNRSINQTYLSTYHLSPRTTPAVVDWLNTQDFAFYTGYPSAMYAFARFMREAGRELTRFPRHIVSGSDALLPAFEAAIGAAFHAPVTDQYGSAEACGNIARCELGKYHVDAEFCIVEAIPIDPSQPRVCRLVFTGFGNPAMPFIRYDVGDYGLLSEAPCKCGRASMTFDRIEGRTEDFLRTRDGRLVVGMNQALEWAPNLIEAQIRQESIDRLDVLVVPGPEYGHGDERILERQIRARVGDDMDVRFHRVVEIPRASNGKFRAVVSTLAADTEEEAGLARAVREGILGG